MEDYLQLLSKDYSACCQYLLAKYGGATDDYFSQVSYQRFKNGEIKTPAKRKISRTKEGLYVHHIDEDKQIMISNSAAIRQFDIPFAYQQKNRLVYCNLIEHGILHILIAKQTAAVLGVDGQEYGVGGYINFIRPQLVQWLVKEVVPKLAWQQNCRNAIFMPKERAEELILAMDTFLIKNYPISQAKIEQATDEWFYQVALR